MAYAARPSDFHRALPLSRPAARVPSPGLFSRILDALLDTRRRQAQRDVEAYLARRGYRLTDSIEREMDAQLFRGDWQSR